MRNWQKTAKFFLSKIEKMRKTFINKPAYKASQCDIPKFAASFHPLTEVKVCSVIMTMMNKHSELDIILTSTLKQMLDACLPVNIQIVNLSLTMGEFCEEWKTTIVKPLLKKPGLYLINKNYRPISNLPFISKLGRKNACSNTSWVIVKIMTYYKIFNQLIMDTTVQRRVLSSSPMTYSGQWKDSR